MRLSSRWNGKADKYTLEKKISKQENSSEEITENKAPYI